MSDNVRNKRVLITGCSSGFGLLTAGEAARAGYEVGATMRSLVKGGYSRTAGDRTDGAGGDWRERFGTRPSSVVSLSGWNPRCATS